MAGNTDFFASINVPSIVHGCIEQISVISEPSAEQLSSKQLKILQAFEQALNKEEQAYAINSIGLYLEEINPIRIGKIVDALNNEADGYLDKNGIVKPAITHDMLPDLNFAVVDNKRYSIQNIFVASKSTIGVIENEGLFCKFNNWITPDKITAFARADKWTINQAASLVSGMSPPSANSGNNSPYHKKADKLLQEIQTWELNGDGSPFNYINHFLIKEIQIYPPIKDTVVLQFKKNYNINFKLARKYPVLAKAADIEFYEGDYERLIANELSAHEFAALVCGFDPEKLKKAKNEDWVASNYFENVFSQIYSTVKEWNLDRVDIFEWLEKSLAKNYPKLENMPEELLEAAKSKLDNTIRNASDPDSTKSIATSYPSLCKYFKFPLEESYLTEISAPNQPLSNLKSDKSFKPSSEDFSTSLERKKLLAIIGAMAHLLEKDAHQKYLHGRNINIRAIAKGVLEQLVNNKDKHPKGMGDTRIREMLHEGLKLSTEYAEYVIGAFIEKGIEALPEIKLPDEKIK